MAKLPSVDELIKNPKKAIKHLSNAQLASLVEQMQSLADAARKRNKDIPDNPAEFAKKYNIQTRQGKQWTVAPHLALLSTWLKDAESGRKRFLLVSMPPRHGKSELISFITPLWLLARNPTKRVVVASYEANFAEEWGKRVRNAVLEYKELGLDLDMSTTAASRWNLTSGGGMQSMGVGGPLTGKGADFLIIDDPFKNYEEASSEVIRENLWNWFMSTAFTRLEPGGACVILATRWHDDDLIGRLDKNTQLAKEQEAEGKEPEHIQWDVLRIPAIAEADDQLGRPVGAPLWPERYDLIELEKIKKVLSPYLWSAQYQQRPTPEEGGSIKRSWWQYYKALPAEFDQMIQSWDLAFEDLTKSDYCVGQVWGRKGAQFFLVDQIRDHMNIIDVMNGVRSFTSRYPKATAKIVEAAANGPALIQTLQHEVHGMIAVKPKGTKDARLQAVAPLIQAGNVYLPQQPSGECARWVYEFIDECAAFPNGTNDDQLDAMVHALQYMLPRGWSFMAKEASDKIPQEPVSSPLDAMTTAFHHQLKLKVRKNVRAYNQKQRKDIITVGPGVPWRGRMW